MASQRVTRSVARRVSAATNGRIFDLGPELLNLIFTKLAPSPLNLAAVPCVCQAWRRIMQEQTWQQLCLEVAPGLCRALGYDAADGPPGGWAAMYKLLFFCAARFRMSWYFDGWSSLGHVQTQSSGFQTGPEIASDLRLKDQFRRDVLFVSRPCFHGDEIGDRHSTRMHVCRGLIPEVAKSALAKRAGARKYSESPPELQQRMRDSASDRCQYCQAPSYELESRVLADRDCSSSEDMDSDEELEGFDFSGHVCGNGHVMLEILGNLGETPFSGAESVRDVRGGLPVETSKTKKEVCGLFGLDPTAEFERKLWKSLDAFSMFRKLECLAREVQERGVLTYEICEDTDKDRVRTNSSTGRQVILDLERERTGLEKQIIRIIEAFERDSKADSETDSEADRGPGPFWQVSADAIQCVRDLLLAVPQCKRILARFLTGSCKRSVGTVLARVERLKLLGLRKAQIRKALWPFQRRGGMSPRRHF